MDPWKFNGGILGFICEILIVNSCPCGIKNLRGAPLQKAKAYVVRCRLTNDIHEKYVSICRDFPIGL